jgi:acyl-CoA synthetase (AMP-forming)/AMP-acid ligase II
MYPLSHVQVRIAESGAIEISSPALLTGQITFAKDGSSRLIDPKRTEADGRIWFRTEDRGQLADSGAVQVEGRTIDFVKIGGEGVVLSRLEEKLESTKATHRIQFDAVVLAAADERLGAKIILISTGPERETESLTAAFNNAVLPFERIRSRHYLAAIPRSALGKLLRFDALTAVGLKPVINV